MKLLFLDESGDHSLDVIDGDYPVFVLGGVIVDRRYYWTVVEPRIRSLKEEFFDDDVVIHTADIIRKRNGFEALSDPKLRERFYDALNETMASLEYSVVACAIKKEEYKQRYGGRAVDPYELGLEIVIERFCHELGPVESGGLIFAEKRRPDLDHVLDTRWRKFRERGTDYIRSHHLDERIVDLSLKGKSLNIAGLQLADLVVSPIGRFVIGKAPRADWNIVKSKLRSHNGNYLGYGLKIMP